MECYLKNTFVSVYQVFEQGLDCVNQQAYMCADAWESNLHVQLTKPEHWVRELEPPDHNLATTLV